MTGTSLDVLGEPCFAVFNVERWVASKTESHVAATAAVLRGLSDSVETGQTTDLSTGRKDRGNWMEWEVFELKLPT